MALTYALGLEKLLEPAEAVEALLRALGGEMLDGGRLALDDELDVGAWLAESPPEREDFLDQWGFELGLRIVFSMGHKTDPAALAASEKRIASAAILLPVEFDSNAGLMFQTGAKFMLRRDGQFTLYGDWRPWRDPAILAAIDGPYTVDPRTVVD